MSARDWFPFLGCLLLSFGVWVAVSVSRGGSAVEVVSVIAVSSIDGYAAKSSAAVEVAARCFAPEYALRYLSRHEDRPVEVRFNASDFEKEPDGSFSLDASVMQRYVPDIFGENVSVESFLSQKTVFRFDKEEFLILPVEPVVHLDFKQQYALKGEISLTPDSVLVYGNPAKIGLVERIRTKPLTLNELSRDAHGIVELETPPGLRLSDAEVAYNVPVCRYVRIDAELGITVKNAPLEVETVVFPQKAKVCAKCEFPLVGDFPGQAYCYVDYDEFVSSSSGKCVIRVAGLPDGVISYVVEPSACDCVEKGK